MPSRRPLVALGFATLMVPAFSVACKKTTAMTATGCEVVISNAQAAVQSAEHEVNATAKCDADADCLESATAKCCDECKRWTDGSCDVIAPRPVPSCPRYTPRCKDHRCTMIEPGS